MTGKGGENLAFEFRQNDVGTARDSHHAHNAHQQHRQPNGRAHEDNGQQDRKGQKTDFNVAQWFAPAIVRVTLPVRAAMTRSVADQSPTITPTPAGNSAAK